MPRRRVDTVLQLALLPLAAAAGLPWWSARWTSLYADAAALHVTAAAVLIGLLATSRRRRGLMIAAALTAGAAGGRWAPAGLPSWPDTPRAAETDWVLAHANLGPAPDLITLGAWVTETRPHAVSLQELRAGTSAALSDVLPGYSRVVAESRTDTRGVGLWIRDDVGAAPARITWLGRRDDASDRPVASVRLSRGNAALQLVGVHTKRPRSAATAAIQRTELATLAERFPARDGVAVVWLGDFNAVPWSTPVKDAAKTARLKPVRGARLWTPTWLPRPGPIPGWSVAARYAGVPLDFALTSRPHAARLRSGPDLGSDHLPLLLRITAAR